MKRNNGFVKILFAGVLLLLCLSVVFSITSCGTPRDGVKDSEKITESETDSAPSESAPDTSSTEDSESITENIDLAEDYDGEKVINIAGGLFIFLGRDADEQTEICGEPLEVSEAPSCIYEGTDKICYYNGYSFTSSPDKDGNNIVVMMEMTTDEVELVNGIKVGSLLSDALEVFGEDYEESFGRYVYSGEEVETVIVADGEHVSSISFSLKDY